MNKRTEKLIQKLSKDLRGFKNQIEDLVIMKWGAKNAPLNDQEKLQLLLTYLGIHEQRRYTAWFIILAISTIILNILTTFTILSLR